MAMNRDRTIRDQITEIYESTKYLEEDEDLDFTYFLEARFSFFQIWEILTRFHSEKNNSTDSLLLEIEKFLSKRWNRIKNTSQTYNVVYHRPISQLCISLAGIIAPELKTSSFQLLMPTLRKDTYDIVENCNTDIALMNKDLLISEFCLSDDKTRPIKLVPCLEYSKENGILKHTHLINGKSESLSDKETPRVVNHSSETSSIYNDIIILIQLKKEEKSIGANVRRLVEHLYYGSVFGHQDGTEFKAGAAALNGIAEFYNFIQILSNDERQSLYACTAPGITVAPNFGIIWLRLLFRAVLEGKINLPEPEMKAILITLADHPTDQEPCVYLIGGNIEQILSHNKNLFGTYPTTNGLENKNESKKIKELEKKIDLQLAQFQSKIRNLNSGFKSLQKDTHDRFIMLNELLGCSLTPVPESFHVYNNIEFNEDFKQVNPTSNLRKITPDEIKNLLLHVHQWNTYTLWESLVPFGSDTVENREIFIKKATDKFELFFGMAKFHMNQRIQQRLKNSTSVGDLYNDWLQIMNMLIPDTDYLAFLSYLSKEKKSDSISLIGLHHVRNLFAKKFDTNLFDLCANSYKNGRLVFYKDFFNLSHSNSESISPMLYRYLLQFLGKNEYKEDKEDFKVKVNIPTSDASKMLKLLTTELMKFKETDRKELLCYISKEFLTSHFSTADDIISYLIEYVDYYNHGIFTPLLILKLIDKDHLKKITQVLSIGHIGQYVSRIRVAHAHNFLNLLFQTIDAECLKRIFPDCYTLSKFTKKHNLWVSHSLKLFGKEQIRSYIDFISSLELIDDEYYYLQDIIASLGSSVIKKIMTEPYHLEDFIVFVSSGKSSFSIKETKDVSDYLKIDQHKIKMKIRSHNIYEKGGILVTKERVDYYLDCILKLLSDKRTSRNNESKSNIESKDSNPTPLQVMVSKTIDQGYFDEFIQNIYAGLISKKYKAGDKFKNISEVLESYNLLNVELRCCFSFAKNNYSSYYSQLLLLRHALHLYIHSLPHRKKYFDFGIFDHSKKEKLQAANALAAVMDGKTSVMDLREYTSALEQGQLGVLFRHFLYYSKVMSNKDVVCLSLDGVTPYQTYHSDLFMRSY